MGNKNRTIKQLLKALVGKKKPSLKKAMKRAKKQLLKEGWVQSGAAMRARLSESKDKGMKGTNG